MTQQTTTQPALPMAGLPPETRKLTIQEQFEQFDAANPSVYSEVKKYALEFLAKGKKCGMKYLIEKVRWESEIPTIGSRFKIPNAFCSRYVRKLMADVPALADFFKVKNLRSA